MVCRSLTDLSEDLIFGIAFSGYLGFNWQSMRNILLTSKTLYIIGQRQVGLISFNDDLLEDSFLTTMRTLRNVSCINIPYMPYTMTSEVMTYMSTFYRTLHGLNLRGTEVDDVALLKLLQCHPLVQQRQASPVDSSSPPSSSSSLLSPDDIDKLSIGDPFPKLRFLDLSKSHSTQRPLITDLGLRTFQSCTGIRWLSLGMTSITDSTIEWICNSMKSLENLSIPLCHGITDKCCHVLRQTKLVVLDITFCKGLTNAAIAILFENK